ncbi:hypothetical protein ZIOFF_006980 [Zingiber officinale]|uniref:Uncharacterized protein n=1 Tax=Zingiber officinale TaxID=94328 RepID=A0A8J5ICV7_ZINOF|nr:hypothetical protein ZIOFF_006980 [Zingiber officinale]
MLAMCASPNAMPVSLPRLATSPPLCPSVDQLVDRFLSGSSRYHRSTLAGAAQLRSSTNSLWRSRCSWISPNAKKAKLDVRHGELALQSPELDWAKDVDKVESNQLKDGSKRLKMRPDRQRNKDYLHAAAGQSMPMSLLATRTLRLLSSSSSSYPSWAIDFRMNQS